jgi:hypothetical protein
MPKKILKIFPKTFILAILAFFVGIVIIFLHQLSKADSLLRTNDLFDEQLLTSSYDLFDLGVVDVNNDNLLDIFTANHSARQKLLINENSLNFTDRFLQLGLSQYSEFPGLDATPNEALD